MMLTVDQARLLWVHAGAWMLAATIVDPDYGISSLKGRQGGKAWPNGSHPDLPYNHTQTEPSRIIGYTVDRATWENNPPLAVVLFTEIRRWVAQVPEHVKTELRSQFGAMADERNRAEKWCRCPYATEAPNPHSEPCKRYHPTEDEEQQRRNVMAGLDDRQAEWVQRALGLTDDADPVGQLELFGATS